MTNSGRAAKPTMISNEDVALAALLLCGGEVSKIDTEDVALKADELSPGRFRWKKYKQHIDLGLVRNGLQDAKKTGNVKGGALEGWALTDDGLPTAKELLSRLSGAGEQVRLTPQQKAWRTRERSRLVGEVAFKAAVNGDLESVSRSNLLRFFRIDEYISPQGREERISRLINAFDDEPELSGNIRALAEKLKNG
jgi:hypothetical protein